MNLKPQRLLVLWDSGDVHSAAMWANARRALCDARLEFVAQDLAASIELPHLGAFTALVTCAERLWLLDARQERAVVDFVKAGGGLAVLYRGWNAALAGVAGIVVNGSPRFLEADASTEGLRLRGRWFRGFGGVDFPPATISGHTPYDLLPGPTAEIVATSSAGRPLAWLTRVGAGRALYWNTAVMGVKHGRGLIIQSIMAVLEVGILPLANAAVVQIDDFPAPLENVSTAPIAGELPGMTGDEFYHRVWHPDMLALARDQGLVFTYLVMFNYNQRNSPPFLFDDWNETRVEIEGRELAADSYAAGVAARHGELGLHGYNHRALVKELWPSRADMRASLEAAAERWHRDGLGEPPTTYVPPDNQYDRTGAVALTEGLPSLQILCGTYLSGDPERGCMREFGPEPWNPRLYCMPRATSGFEPTAGMVFNQASQLASLGVWTHFLHPDDVFDVPREGAAAELVRNPDHRPWRGSADNPGLLLLLTKWIQDVKSACPWLRFLSTRAAQRVIRSHLEGRWVIGGDPAGIRIEAPSGSFFQLRLNGEQRLDEARSRNAEVVHREEHEDFEIFTMRSLAPELTLALR